jgi:CO/xanthine dehydrogenase Mo-binding subunit
MERGADYDTRATLTRRAVLRGTGSLILTFATGSIGAAEDSVGSQAPRIPTQPPGSLERSPYLDGWIRIEADGTVTAFTGKAELGQGIKTALLQVTAEELAVPIDRLTLVTADTERTPNEGYTAGSHSMQDSGTGLRNAAAQAREILLAEAARRLGLPIDRLKAQNGAVLAPGGQRVSYGELVSETLLHVRAQPVSRLAQPPHFRYIDKSQPRVDIPAKVTGGSAYVHDMRLPGMLHARVVRPPSYGAVLIDFDESRVAQLPGVVKVIRDGNFLAVVAQREFLAIKAMRALEGSARWQEKAALPQQSDLIQALMALPAEDHTILDRPGGSGDPGHSLQATFTRPYIAHASVGPSCAIAVFQDGHLTVWSHTQGAYPDRQAICEMLALPLEKVRCIHVEGSGCYGHNGADDAAADAALIASHLPSHPIRLQWMREQEFAWEPFGPAMIAQVRASLDASGRIAAWDYGVWSNTHATRPGPAGSVLAGQYCARAFQSPSPRPVPQPEGGGDRNAIPLYALPRARVVHHFIPSMPLRVSALRSLGAHMNVFAIESFMDELARAARTDPVEFRLRHLEDTRARDVINATAGRFGWAQRRQGTQGHGYGFSFARYKNLAAYCAVALEVDVERETGSVRVGRVVATVDTGQVVNPDGVRNQIEGGILQSLSWTLLESVRFDARRILSVDWSTYPIMRFSAVPASVDVQLIDRPGEPFLGCGEASQGPGAAALANAVADATGRRVRDLPLTAARIKAAMDARQSA